MFDYKPFKKREQQFSKGLDELSCERPRPGNRRGRRRSARRGSSAGYSRKNFIED